MSNVPVFLSFFLTVTSSLFCDYKLCHYATIINEDLICSGDATDMNNNRTCFETTVIYNDSKTHNITCLEFGSCQKIKIYIKSPSFVNLDCTRK